MTFSELKIEIIGEDFPLESDQYPGHSLPAPLKPSKTTTEPIECLKHHNISFSSEEEAGAKEILRIVNYYWTFSGSVPLNFAGTEPFLWLMRRHEKTRRCSVTWLGFFSISPEAVRAGFPVWPECNRHRRFPVLLLSQSHRERRHWQCHFPLPPECHVLDRRS